jgi:transcriptional regulator with XRE-family HTH domain
MLHVATSYQYNQLEVLSKMGNILADRLRLLRKERKLTQGNMASAILVPRVTYTHYELGKRTPDLDTIIMLARFHHVSIDYLVGNAQMRSTLEHWLDSSNLNITGTDSNNCYSAANSEGNLVADRPLAQE